MSKKIYGIAVFIGLVLGLFLFSKIGKTKMLEEDKNELQDTLVEIELPPNVDTSKITATKFEPSYYPIDSIKVNGMLFRLKQESDADSKIDYFLLECFQSENQEWEKLQEWKLVGNYEGMTKRNYNRDKYADLCVRMNVLGHDTISLENKHTLLIYQPTSKTFKKLVNCWDTIGLVDEFGEGADCCAIFGTKGEEYELKKGLGYFCSPATYRGYEPALWTSCLWSIEGMDIQLHGHLELVGDMFYYYPKNAKYAKDSLKQKLGYDLDDVNKIMKNYWTRNRRRVF